MPSRVSPPVALRAAFLFAAALFALLQTGCIFNLRKFFAQPEPCVLPANPTQADLVRYINERSARLVSWQSNDVRIVTRAPNSLPMKLSAFIAVESPRNFRLTASSMLGYEADFGSNDDRFWFWMRRSQPKKIFYARHEELAAVQRRLPIPFRPDWLIDALLVVPLDAGRTQLTPTDEPSNLALLTTDEMSPTGRPVRRAVWVDPCYGHIVKQQLQDSGGRVIASAEFNDYRRDSDSGLKMPHRIDLHWPQQQVTMTLHLGHIEVNPGDFAARTWTFPEYEGYSPFNLARDAMSGAPLRRQLPGRNAPPVSINPTQQDPLRGRPAQRDDHMERPNFVDEVSHDDSDDVPRHPTGGGGGVIRADDSSSPAASNRQQGGRVRISDGSGPFPAPFPGSEEVERPHFANE